MEAGKQSTREKLGCPSYQARVFSNTHQTKGKISRSHVTPFPGCSGSLPVNSWGWDQKVL